MKPAPALFLGHGSPMNAIEDNEFHRGWRAAADEFEKPKAVLCVSAHWETHPPAATPLWRERRPNSAKAPASS